MSAIKRFYLQLFLKVLPVGIALFFLAYGLYYTLLNHFDYELDMRITAGVTGLLFAGAIRHFMKGVMEDLKAERERRKY